MLNGKAELPEYEGPWDEFDQLWLLKKVRKESEQISRGLDALERSPNLTDAMILWKCQFDAMSLYASCEPDGPVKERLVAILDKRHKALSAIIRRARERANADLAC
jgi:hypothetical protein